MPSVGISKGFTLVELLVALAVAAILVALAAPSFSGLFERKRLQSAAEAVARHLQFTRSEAVKRNIQLTSVVKSEGAWCVGTTMRTLCDCTVRDPGSFSACALPLASDTALYVIDGSEYEDVSVGKVTLSRNKTAFDPVRGTVTNPDTGGLGNGSIYLVSDSGRFTLRVVISNLGRVRICSPNGDMAGYEKC